MLLLQGKADPYIDRKCKIASGIDTKPDQLRPMAGYVFLVFEEEASVQRLVNQCFEDQERYALIYIYNIYVLMLLVKSYNL